MEDLFKKKGKKSKSKRSAPATATPATAPVASVLTDPTENINDFLDYIITLNPESAGKIAQNPSGPTEKEYRHIAINLNKLSLLKQFVSYLRKNNIQYSRDVLREFMKANNIDEVDMEEYEDDSDTEDKGDKGTIDEHPRRNKPKQPRGEYADGSDLEDDSEEDMDSSSSEDEDDEPVAPPPPRPRQVPVSDDDDTIAEMLKNRIAAEVNKSKRTAWDIISRRIRENNMTMSEEELEEELSSALVALNSEYEAYLLTMPKSTSKQDAWEIVSSRFRKTRPELSDGKINGAIDKLKADYEAYVLTKPKSLILPDSYRENQLRAKENPTREEQKELKDIIQDRERFEARLRQVQDQSLIVNPKEYNRIQKFWINIYKNAEWMRQDNNSVESIYIDNPNYSIVKSHPDRQEIDGAGSWSLANNTFFELLANSNSMRQTGNTLHISSLKNGGILVDVRILYKYTDGTLVEQNENIFNIMQQYLKVLHAPPTVRKDMANDEKFLINNNAARKLGKINLAFPDGDLQETTIAEQISDENQSIKEYFTRIANITAYLKDNSVFNQRLLMGWFPGYLSNLSVYDKIDYEELAPYYADLVVYEVEKLKWDYYVLTGGKIVKHFEKEPKRPDNIPNENLDGSRITFPPNASGAVYQIIGIETSDKTPEFIQKLARISAVVQLETSPRVYKKTLWNIVDDALEYARTNQGTIEGWTPQI